MLSEQNLLAFPNQNANFNAPSISSETYNSTPFYEIHDSGRLSTRMIPLHSLQSYDAIPVEQASSASPFLTSLGSGNSSNHLISDQSLDLGGDLAFPVCDTSHHEPYGLHNSTTACYSNFDSAPLQPLSPPTQPSTIFGPNWTVETPVTGPKLHFCPFGCRKPFARKADMERHTRSHGPPSLQCGARGCSKGFYRKDKLNEHMKTHKKH